MERLIGSIREGTQLIIKGKGYTAEAKARYVTQKNPDNWYVKVFLDKHYVLVMCPSDCIIYFGKDVGSIGGSFEKDIEYDGKKYHMISNDHQLMTDLEFGSPLTTEDEVDFWDYECSGGGKIISVGIIKRTGKRADIVADVISLEDIRIQ